MTCFMLPLSARIPPDNGTHCRCLPPALRAAASCRKARPLENLGTQMLRRFNHLPCLPSFHSMGAVKTRIEQALPGTYVYSVMVGQTPEEGTPQNFTALSRVHASPP